MTGSAMIMGSLLRRLAVLALAFAAVIFGAAGAARAQSADSDYVLGAGDKLRIQVFGEDDLLSLIHI